MPTAPTKKRGGARKGAGRKPCSEKGDTARTKNLSVKVEPDIADWIKLNGGSKLHYQILRRALIETHII